jgi:hypothetical protein
MRQTTSTGPPFTHPQAGCSLHDQTPTPAPATAQRRVDIHDPQQRRLNALCSVLPRQNRRRTHCGIQFFSGRSLTWLKCHRILRRHRRIDVRPAFSGVSAEPAVRLPRGRGLRAFTVMMAHLPGSHHLCGYRLCPRAENLIAEGCTPASWPRNA